MSTRFRTPRRRFDQDPPARVLTRAAVVVALMGAFLYLAATIYNGVPLRDYRYVDAVVPDPGSLIPHDPVRIAGARVGQVKEVGADPRGGARVRLQLEPGTELTADTQIVIRANGLLGARFVELRPGASDRPLPDGGVIRGGEDSLTFGVPEALEVLDAPTRRGLDTTIAETGRGFGGQGGNLNDALRVAGDVITPSATLFEHLRRSGRANAALLPSIAAAMRPLDANRVGLTRLFGATADGLGPIPARRAATRATLSAAPGALAAADAGLARTTTLVRNVRRLTAEVRRTLPRAPSGLRETSALLEEAPGPLRRTTALVDAARPAVPAVLRLTRTLRPVLEPVRDLAAGLVPIVDTIAPYRCDIENVGVVMRSMTGFGSRAPGGPGGPPMQFRLQAVTPTGFENLSLPDPTGRLLRRESYTAPCTYLSKPYPVVLPRPATRGAR